MPTFTVYPGGRMVYSNAKVESRHMRNRGYSVRYIAEVMRKPEAVIRRWTSGIGKGRNTSLMTNGGMFC